MKKCFIAFLMLSSFAAVANEFDVNGGFAGDGKDGLPKGWQFHTWEGYMPRPSASIVEGDAPGVRAMRIRDVRGKHGAGVMAAVKRPGGRGDRVTVSLVARGKGKAWATLVRWTAKGGWNQTESRAAIDLTDEWTAHECVFVLHDGPNDETRSFQVELGLDNGSEAEFADVAADHVPATPEERAAVDPKCRRDLRRIVEPVRDLVQDDFEDAARQRSPKPDLVQDIIAPGLLSKTMLGVYRSEKEFAVPLDGGKAARLPDDSGTFLVANVRIYDFGRSARAAAAATLDLAVEGGPAARRLGARIESDPARADLMCDVLRDGVRAGHVRVPVKSLPADFSLGVSAGGEWMFKVTSLSDSSVRERRGTVDPFAVGSMAHAALVVSPRGGTAEITVDSLALGEEKSLLRDMTPPIIVERAKEFDPVKAGWPLVFADEFDGDSLDWSKWFTPWYVKKERARHFSLDGKGHLVLKVEKDPKTGKLETGSIWTKGSWCYGYYEARLRYTRKPGWWSAFWLYGVSNRNPFWDGFEIDIQEDYYTRPKKKGGPGRKTIDHNVHVYTGPLLKSWNYNSELPGPVEDFYTLGCKWTPFEISYYHNGKLIASKSSHSPYDSVTFDAFHHVYGLTPLHAIVSGQIMGKQWFASDIEGVEFPEEYVLDHVRIYKYPEPPGEDPVVTFAKNQDRSLFAKTGARLKFAVDVKSSDTTKSPIKAVYLFDEGYMLDFKTEPPYEFEVPFTKAFYSKTRWGKAGRSGERPEFGSYPHVFVVAAQDEKGRVGRSERIVKILRNADGFEPHDNVDRVVPGFVPSNQYDDGGQGVAYHDTTSGNKFWGRKIRPHEDVDAGPDTLYFTDTGEWLNYTLRVEKGGAFAVTIKTGEIANIPDTRHIPLYMDGRLLGCFDVDAARPDDGRVLDVRLPAGRHTFTVVLHAPISFKGLDFAARP